MSKKLRDADMSLVSTGCLDMMLTPITYDLKGSLVSMDMMEMIH